MKLTEQKCNLTFINQYDTQHYVAQFHKWNTEFHLLVLFTLTYVSHDFIAAQLIWKMFKIKLSFWRKKNNLKNKNTYHSNGTDSISISGSFMSLKNSPGFAPANHARPRRLFSVRNCNCLQFILAEANWMIATLKERKVKW